MMSYSAADYQQALLALLPHGAAWPRDEDGELAKLMLGLAQEFARIDARAGTLLLESLPSETQALLSEWEQDYGLPDTCSRALQTVDERKAALLQKYRLYGSQSREFLTELAANLGIAITVSEYKHRRFGDSFGLPWRGLGWNFVIEVTAHGLIDQLNAVLIARLQCVMRRTVHAHKALIFHFTDVLHLATGEPFTFAMDEPLHINNTATS